VRRQLDALDLSTGLAVALVLEAATALGQVRAGQTDAADRAAFLLPLAKTFGGELAFEVADGALQVLGGAGHRRDWPIERYLSDARILTIYEKPTGIPAQAFLPRHLLRDEGRGLAAQLARLRTELSDRAGTDSTGIRPCLDRFERLAGDVAAVDRGVLDEVATDVLRAGSTAPGSALTARLQAVGFPSAAVEGWLIEANSSLVAVEQRIASAMKAC
jgi:hypothetical protein